MRKSMLLGLNEYFEEMPSYEDLSQLKYRIDMRNASKSYWKEHSEEAILQEFDGLHGYLYSIDILLNDEKYIPFQTEKADLHIVYILSDDAPVNIDNQDGTAICQVSSGRAVYLYLPPDHYQFHLPKGTTQLFGFYFRASVFRQGNDRAYDFIHPLLDAHRQKGIYPLASRDFMVGPKTRYQIEVLCTNLHPRQLKNDHFILGVILNLIELSRNKIANEDHNAPYELRIAQEAADLLAAYVENEGQQALLKKLEEPLRQTLANVNRLHRIYFGKTLQQFRDELLLERACELLRSGLSPKETAYTLQYSSPEAFFHFFKKNKGLSPSAYLKSL